MDKQTELTDSLSINKDGELVTSLTIRIDAEELEVYHNHLFDVARYNNLPSEELEKPLTPKQISNILVDLYDGYDSDYGIDANTIRHAICGELGIDSTMYFI